MRQTEQSLTPSPIQRGLQAPLPQALELSDTTVIRADHFNFVGAKRLTPEQLTQVTDQYLNRALNKNDLFHLTESVAARYRQSGWFVRVYIPQQDINQSDISIQILENMPSSAR